MNDISGKNLEVHQTEPGHVDMLQGVAGGFVEGNRMLKTLMDAMPIGCYVLRPDHTVLYWNPAAEKLLGFSAEEMQDKRCVDMPLGCSFTNSTHIKGAHCPAIVVYATGKAKTLEMFMRRKDGRKADKFCRWGGDEFVGLLHLRHPEDIEGAAKRFLKIAHNCEVTEDRKTVSCRASIGITVVRDDDTIKSIVSRADHYMYLAKKRKEDQIVTDFDQ